MFLDLLKKRRSIRQFTVQPVEKEKIDLLIEAMLRSPSSRGLNPWEFVVVTEQEAINDLAKAKLHGSTFMKNAPLAIVVCGDPGRGDVWVEDCSIAALIIHLAATDLGLGSCWIQIRKRDHDGQITAEEYVKKRLAITGNLMVEAMIAIGYPKEEKPEHPLSSLPYDKVSFEEYGKKKW
jgi:nitroreductase